LNTQLKVFIWKHWCYCWQLCALFFNSDTNNINKITNKTNKMTKIFAFLLDLLPWEVRKLGPTCKPGIFLNAWKNNRFFPAHKGKARLASNFSAKTLCYWRHLKLHRYITTNFVSYYWRPSFSNEALLNIQGHHFPLLNREYSNLSLELYKTICCH
jgi:hypothetical protein